MQRVAASLKRAGCDVAALYAAHQNAHKRSREAWSPAVTNWDVYEGAASKFPGCAYNDKLVDILGFKTAVVSPSISTSDRLPTTTYNGKGASELLRAQGNDISIVRRGARAASATSVSSMARRQLRPRYDHINTNSTLFLVA